MSVSQGRGVHPHAVVGGCRRCRGCLMTRPGASSRMLGRPATACWRPATWVGSLSFCMTAILAQLKACSWLATVMHPACAHRSMRSAGTQQQTPVIVVHQTRQDAGAACIRPCACGCRLPDGHSISGGHDAGAAGGLRGTAPSQVLQQAKGPWHPGHPAHELHRCPAVLRRAGHCILTCTTCCFCRLLAAV